MMKFWLNWFKIVDFYADSSYFLFHVSQHYLLMECIKLEAIFLSSDFIKKLWKVGNKMIIL